MSGPPDKNKGEFVIESDDGETVDDAYLHSTILPELEDLGKNDLVVGEGAEDDDDLSDLDDLAAL